MTQSSVRLSKSIWKDERGSRKAPFLLSTIRGSDSKRFYDTKVGKCIADLLEALRVSYIKEKEPLGSSC